jgi:hypothetical protein
MDGGGSPGVVTRASLELVLWGYAFEDGGCVRTQTQESRATASHGKLYGSICLHHVE